MQFIKEKGAGRVKRTWMEVGRKSARGDAFFSPAHGLATIRLGFALIRVRVYTGATSITSKG